MQCSHRPNSSKAAEIYLLLYLQLMTPIGYFLFLNIKDLFVNDFENMFPSFLMQNFDTKRFVSLQKFTLQWITGSKISSTCTLTLLSAIEWGMLLSARGILNTLLAY